MDDLIVQLTKKRLRREITATEFVKLCDNNMAFKQFMVNKCRWSRLSILEMIKQVDMPPLVTHMSLETLLCSPEALLTYLCTAVEFTLHRERMRVLAQPYLDEKVQKLVQDMTIFNATEDQEQRDQVKVDGLFSGEEGTGCPAWLLTTDSHYQPCEGKPVGGSCSHPECVAGCTYCGQHSFCRNGKTEPACGRTITRRGRGFDYLCFYRLNDGTCCKCNKLTRLYMPGLRQRRPRAPRPVIIIPHPLAVLVRATLPRPPSPEPVGR